MTIDQELLKILACPVCRGRVEVLPSGGSIPEGLCCGACSAVYPIRDDIPVMLKEEAIMRADWDKGERLAVKKNRQERAGGYI